MINHRLRAAISAAGLTYQQLAEELGVSPKTVERWVSQARVPYPRHRLGLVERLAKAEVYLWPELADAPIDDDGAAGGIGTNEVLRLYPYRAGVPTSLWTRLIDGAEDRVDLLLDTEPLLVEQVPDLADRLAARADRGVRVRLLVSDPSFRDVVRQVVDRPGVEVQLHRTPLFASIHQFDDEMLVTSHLYGLGAAYAPVLHLQGRSNGPLFETYVMAFERVWQTALET